jgi:hypothetical protein
MVSVRILSSTASKLGQRLLDVAVVVSMRRRRLSLIGVRGKEDSRVAAVGLLHKLIDETHLRISRLRLLLLLGAIHSTKQELHLHLVIDGVG